MLYISVSEAFLANTRSNYKSVLPNTLIIVEVGSQGGKTRPHGLLVYIVLSSLSCIVTNRIYDVVEAETRKSQASFQII